MDFYRLKDQCVNWIRDWFSNNGNSCCAVIGISGGKDSTITAALCAEALGKSRVVGVSMPAEGQGLNEADIICDYLGIRYICAPIDGIVKGFDTVRSKLDGGFSRQAEQNIPPRARMATLYAISQTLNGRVANTCNLSEDWIGYATRWGDNVGDFSPLSGLTVQEVKGIGHALHLPAKWVEKIPDDGLPHSCSDEEKFGFSYKVLDKYIRTGECDDPVTKDKIDKMHSANMFKLSMPEGFNPFR